MRNENATTYAMKYYNPTEVSNIGEALATYTAIILPSGKKYGVKNLKENSDITWDHNDPDIIEMIDRNGTPMVLFPDGIDFKHIITHNAGINTVCKLVPSFIFGLSMRAIGNDIKKNSNHKVRDYIMLVLATVTCGGVIGLIMNKLLPLSMREPDNRKTSLVSDNE